MNYHTGTHEREIHAAMLLCALYHAHTYLVATQKRVWLIYVYIN